MIKHNLLLTLGLVFVTLLLAAPVQAQSFEGQGTMRQTYGASSQSDFQNAAFQQSGSSAATTAAGSGELLKQAATQAITVTGAPAYQAEATAEKSKTPLYLWALLACSGLGIVLLYIYQRKTKKSLTPKEVKETAVVFEEPKPKTDKLDLRKTSLPSDASSTDSKAILSDGGVAMSTPTAEKEVLDGGDAAGVTGILRKSSKSQKTKKKSTKKKKAHR